MRFAGASRGDRICYDRPAAAGIGAEKHSRIGTAGNENIGILRVEGDECRLGIATKSGKGSGTRRFWYRKAPPPVMALSRPASLAQVVPPSVENIIRGPVGLRFEA